MRYLIAVLLFCGCLNGRAQTAVFFHADLRGTNAQPPNASPLVGLAHLAVGERYVPAPSPFPTTNQILLGTNNVLECYVSFPELTFNTLNYSNPPVLPNGASIQKANGKLVLPLERSRYSDSVPAGGRLPYLYRGFRELSAKDWSDLLHGRWFVHVPAIRNTGEALPGGQIRGRIQLISPDADQDGVPDVMDDCPDTPPGVIVNLSGCSVEQLCPCAADWRNHGEFLRCVTRVTAGFVKEDLLTPQQRREIVRHAARSDCAKRREPKN